MSTVATIASFIYGFGALRGRHLGDRIEARRIAVFGIFFSTSFGIGSLSQMATGVLADAYNFDIAFWMITAFAFAALLLSFEIPDKKEAGYPINA